MIPMSMDGAKMGRSVSKPLNRAIRITSLSCLAGFAVLGLLTLGNLKPVADSLHDIVSRTQNIRIVDRSGVPLGISYQNRWNSFDHIPLYEIPAFLKDTFVISEDQHFFTHQGVDWGARFSALFQMFKQGHAVRGASTITEQVVRLINPRPRTLWSRWLEGFEAMMLERGTSKAEILEFYLDQVPYAANRRGIVQAARYYFARDLSTLNQKEMLALVVLVRAPTAYDLYKNPEKIEGAVRRLAVLMQKAGKISAQDIAAISAQNIKTEKAVLPVEARHFARFVRLSAPQTQTGTLHTTLDSGLQKQVQDILNNRLKTLAHKHVSNAAALVADYKTGEILAWVVGAGAQEDQNGEIDTLTTPRQPGSALKPFLYARALDKGWTPATLLDDSPLAKAIGTGFHNFRNYSNTHYGFITLREALGNSLNIPALLTIQYVGAGDYLGLLQKLGFQSLSQSSEIYDEGLALGNGEVTVLEIVQAYGALANKGLYRPFHVLTQNTAPSPPVQIYSSETASLIGNILSDPWARRLEFGAGSVLNLPSQTAAKTGTSNDYRDAWTLAYNDRYVVGLWMGNLDRTPMENVTGSTGPALALRSIFSVLNKNRETTRLFFSPRLTQKDVCIRPMEKDGTCPRHTEWFTPETLPKDSSPPVPEDSGITIIRPTQGLQIAYDPRIPAQHQKFRFEIHGIEQGAKISWTLDDELLATTTAPSYLWPLKRGKHRLSISITQNGDILKTLPSVRFTVK